MQIAHIAHATEGEEKRPDGCHQRPGARVDDVVVMMFLMRVGHVRAFSTFVALILVNALLTGIVVDATWWVALRVITGFCTAGTSMIIESWLNERATNESRGMIFSLYIAITLLGTYRIVTADLCASQCNPLQ